MPTCDNFAQKGKLRPGGRVDAAQQPRPPAPATHQPGVIRPLEIPLHDPVIQADPRVFVPKACRVRGCGSECLPTPLRSRAGAAGEVG